MFIELFEEHLTHTIEVFRRINLVISYLDIDSKLNSGRKILWSRQGLAIFDKLASNLLL